MPSPFPGMDPYLEAHWGDIHHSVITYARDQLQSQLPVDLRARMEERIYLETPDDISRSFYPGVSVIERPVRQSPVELLEPTGVMVADATEPLVVHVIDEEVTESFIEIREVASGNRVITAIEVVSLANKRAGPSAIHP